MAETLNGRALGARLALINGSPGTTWIAGGIPRVAFLFSIENGKIQGIDVVMDPEDLKEMEVEPLDDPGVPDAAGHRRGNNLRVLSSPRLFPKPNWR